MYFHPLRKYPGPKLFAASTLLWGRYYHSGYWHDKVLQLHAQYGHIVRIGPNELSYDLPEAWDEVYGRSKTKPENRRPEWFASRKLHTIIGADEEDQKRMRIVLAPGWSRAALGDQEPIIRKNVDLFMRRLREASCGGSKPINVIRWINYLTFDLIGELMFGDGFGCVAGDAGMRAWQDALIANLRLLHLLVVCQRNWLFYFVLPLPDLWRFFTKYTLFDKVIEARVKAREAHGPPDKTDFLELMRTGRNGAVSVALLAESSTNKSAPTDLSLSSQYMTPEEITSNANLLTFAGSESSANTTATLLFRVAEDTTVRSTILKELQAKFTSEDEISSEKAMSLPYLNAVIQEGMRLHPVTPNASWRETPKQGNEILGDWLPGNVSILPPSVELQILRLISLVTDGSQSSSSRHLPKRTQLQARTRFHPGALDAANGCIRRIRGRSQRRFPSLLIRHENVSRTQVRSLIPRSILLLKCAQALRMLK